MSEQKPARVGDATAMAATGGKTVGGVFSRTPIVVLAGGGVIAALGYGLSTLVSGNKAASQSSMRARVALQGTAVAALVGYGAWHAYRGDNNAER